MRELTNFETELFFGEFIKKIAFELGIPKFAKLRFEETEEQFNLYFCFYEKKFLTTKYVKSLHVRVKKNGDVRFIGGLYNSHTFDMQTPRRFLKYSIANAIEQFLRSDVRYGELAMDLYYG